MKNSICKYKFEILITIVVMVTIGIVILRYGGFVSCGDYLSQHTVFPEYFRNLFYKTGKLIPHFASNIGAGQNIYYFSYYGLLNPLILPSYLMPFLSMNKYMVIMSILCIYLSTISIYKWLKRSFNSMISLFVSIMYLFATPIIYQSHNQIMFVDYMIFLILALLGVDIYYSRRSSCLMIVSIFLMIMTSFYFSIGGMLVVWLYSFYKQVGRDKNKFKDILKEQVYLLFRMLVSVLMRLVLLVPTFFTLIGRQSNSSNLLSIVDLIIPKVSSSRFLYSPYGLGLTSIIIIVIFVGLTYKKISEKILYFGTVIIFLFPIFGYALNGGLYIRDKAFIPFLPLMLFFIAQIMQKLECKQIKFNIILVAVVCTFIFIIFSDYKMQYIKLFAIIDVIVMFICFLIYYKKRRISIIAYPIIIMMIFSNIMIAESDYTEDNREHYNIVNNNNIAKECDSLMKNNELGYRFEKDYLYDGNGNSADINRIDSKNMYTTSFYSSAYNKYYYEFRNKIFCVEQPYRNYLMQGVSENPIFLKLMGVKYTFSNKKIRGREVKEEIDNNKIYDNGSVYPLGYVSTSYISEKEYNKLEFPYNQLALLKYSVVADEAVRRNVKSIDVISNINKSLENIQISIPQIENKNLSVKKLDGNNGYEINAREKERISVKLDKKNSKKQLLFIEFNIENYKKNNDVKVIINGTKNKLSARNSVYYNSNTKFRFVCYLNKGEKKINVSFGSGKYRIYDIKAYTYASNEVEVGTSLCKDSFIITDYWSDGENLKGKIKNNNENDIFITSIPYDKGFTVFVDGKKTDIKKVNKAFLGFDLEEGDHNIIINYNPPGLKCGQIGSGIGVICFLFIIYTERKSNRKI